MSLWSDRWLGTEPIYAAAQPLPAGTPSPGRGRRHTPNANRTQPAPPEPWALLTGPRGSQCAGQTREPPAPLRGLTTPWGGPIAAAAPPAPRPRTAGQRAQLGGARPRGGQPSMCVLVPVTASPPQSPPSASSPSHRQAGKAMSPRTTELFHYCVIFLRTRAPPRPPDTGEPCPASPARPLFSLPSPVPTPGLRTPVLPRAHRPPP